MLADEAVECWIKKSGVDLFVNWLTIFFPFTQLSEVNFRKWKIMMCLPRNWLIDLFNRVLEDSVLV